ncbi:hypothetical protein BDV18DRAFT_146658 [Aspergillus unguis]
MPQQVYIDHLLLQFNQEQFDPLPSWTSDNFTVIDGGVHTGGLSRNKLIIFRDGTYLELYNWIRKPDDWKDRLPGDFALTALAPTTAESSRDRIVRALETNPGDGNLGISHSLPIEGGRKNTEGIEIQWKIVKAQYEQGKSTPPDELYPRGRRTDAPFFCHDVTPRERRVMFDRPNVTQHASGATGIERIEVLVPRGMLERYTDVYSSIIGSAPEKKDGATEFQLKAPNIRRLEGLIRVREALTDEDERFLRETGVGISGLVLRSERGEPIIFPISDYLH